MTLYPYLIGTVIGFSIALLIAFYIKSIIEGSVSLKQFFTAALVISLITTPICLGGVYVVVNAPHYEYRVITTNTSIYSLHKQQTIEGGFFLGCGSIDGVMQYVFYADAGGGGFVLQTLPAKDVVIYQDESEHPYLKHSAEYNVNVETGEIQFTRFGTTHNELHVPPGTIIQEYVL